MSPYRVNAYVPEPKLYDWSWVYKGMAIIAVLVLVACIHACLAGICYWIFDVGSFWKWFVGIFVFNFFFRQAGVKLQQEK